MKFLATTALQVPFENTGMVRTSQYIVLSRSHRMSNNGQGRRKQMNITSALYNLILEFDLSAV